MTDRELVAAYVLDELEGPERADFEQRLESEPALRTELEALTDLSAELETLPVGAWPEEESSHLADPVPSRRSPSPPRRWFTRPAIALCAVLGALVIGGVIGDLLAGGSDGSGSARSVASSSAVALRPLESGSEAAASVRVGSDRTVELDTHNLPRPGRGHYYELWLMTDAAKTVPVASFDVGGSGRARVRVPLPANPKGFRYYDISRQAVGGGTAHSTESVLRGPTGATAH